MKIIMMILSYLAMLFIGAFVQSVVQTKYQVVNQKFSYQITLDLPRSEYDLKKRMVINAIDRSLLEEIQKKKFFPAHDEENK